MKVGILTHYYGSLNYGGMLQAYALAKFLNLRGIDAEQICYSFSSKPFTVSETSVNKTIIKHKDSALQKIMKRAYRSAKYRLINKPREDYYYHYKQELIPLRAKRFAEFQSLVPHSAQVCDQNTITEVVQQYDYLITGSDQVWNFDWFNPAFFLDFPDQHQKKLAYAASAGKSDFSEQEKQYFYHTLSTFDAISVREEDLANILNRILETNSVEQTVDPTLLLTKEEWDTVASPRLIKDKYMFCYFLHNDKELSKLAKHYARKHHLKIATIPFPGIEYIVSDIYFGKYRFDNANPSDFISLIKHAELVMTDSFHATVFSLLYEKEFVSFPRGDAKGMSSRLLTLTKMFGCENRFCHHDIAERMNYLDTLPTLNIDRTKFDFVQKNSEAFLKRNLMID